MSTTTSMENTKNKKNLLPIILIAIIAIGSGAGGAWYVIQNLDTTGETTQSHKKPVKFIDIETFTVNLQPEEDSQYLQVGLTVKTQETDVVNVIKKQMPEIRNRILLLLSSKKPTEILSIAGKQQLSAEITDEIRQTIDSEIMQEEILDVLFTSFVIQ
ncbi:flagellar FliL protein [Nitrosomonas cryotolerans]|uniref:Flagellar protein FliL n=1 Tax=Nitrosomonas cryotolerans ATCC 49181 TaxID=1131553 RepID=A0A1N6I5U8_9PROT|nr:flagellar basal body-associated protein FliL [Nitrosomonas cryotolerans]SFQ10493.1 flagellar FliL protein [Nitrosomonas cryotolerans]SIO27295.1 flagellar FliL protein [Nitrosomonas cryotolerans ATCC 49181]